MDKLAPAWYQMIHVNFLQLKATFWGKCLTVTPFWVYANFQRLHHLIFKITLLGDYTHDGKRIILFTMR